MTGDGAAENESEQPTREPAVDGGIADYPGASRRDEPIDDRTVVENRTGRTGYVASERQVLGAGIWLSASLATVMLAFLLVDWARAAAVPGSTFAVVLFDQYLVIGEWIDFYLGTEVFWAPSSWRSIAVGVFVGIAAPTIGTFLIHREMALVAETLAHTAFAGIAIGVVFSAFVGFQGSLLPIALLVSVLGALGLEWLTRRTTSYGDVPIAIVLAGSFALGTVLLTWSQGRAPIRIDVEGFLFGTLAIVSPTGARLMAVLTLAVVALVVATYRELLFATFDRHVAAASGIPVGRYDSVLVVATAIVVVGAMQLLGVILVAAMLVVPAAAAANVAGSFRSSLYLSVLFGQLSVLCGLAIAFLASLPAGGSIVLVTIGVYLLSVARGDRSGRAIVSH